MSKLIGLLIAILLPAVTFAGPKGPGEGGGGDLCENRVKIVRDDIADWIARGGSQALNLGAVSHTKYAQDMTEQIRIAKIKCVGPGDKEYPVQVNGTAKECRFERTDEESQIICQTDKFDKISENSQYVLVHHEYAGLARLEKPSADSSTYVISNQISGFLETQLVKKLVVRAMPTFTVYDCEVNIGGDKQLVTLRPDIETTFESSLRGAPRIVKIRLDERTKTISSSGLNGSIQCNDKPASVAYLVNAFNSPNAVLGSLTSEHMMGKQVDAPWNLCFLGDPNAFLRDFIQTFEGKSLSSSSCNQDDCFGTNLTTFLNVKGKVLDRESIAVAFDVKEANFTKQDRRMIHSCDFVDPLQRAAREL